MKKQNNPTASKKIDDEFSKIFPQRLMELLNEPSNHDAIIWLPHGKAFQIIDRQKFSSKVLPKYFRKTKYASFTRKLNRWNFSRVAQGPDLGAYYHEFFQRRNEALCIQMYCKNNQFKYATSQDSCSITLPQNHNLISYSASAIGDFEQSSLSNNLYQSITSKINKQTSLKPKAMDLSLNSKILASQKIDPTIYLRSLIAKQQAQIQQERLKLSLINASNPFPSSQLQFQLQPLNQEQISQKLAFIKMQMKAIQVKMKQYQLQGQSQKCSLIRKTSATAA